LNGQAGFFIIGDKRVLSIFTVFCFWTPEYFASKIWFGLFALYQ